MRYTLWSAMALSFAIASLPTTAHAVDAPSHGQDPSAHTTFTWRAWADNEYLADRDAGMDATRLCTKAKGQVIGQESLGTRMLGNGTWHATTRVTCRMN